MERADRPPWRGTRESRSGFTPDRLTFFPTRFRAHKEHFVVARWLPGRHVGTMEIHLAFPKGAGDVHSGQSAVAFANGGDTWDPNRRSSSATMEIAHIEASFLLPGVRRETMRIARWGMCRPDGPNKIADREERCQRVIVWVYQVQRIGQD